MGQAGGAPLLELVSDWDSGTFRDRDGGEANGALPKHHPLSQTG